MAFPFYVYNIAYLAAGHKGKLMFNAYAVMGVYACCHRQLNNDGMTFLIWIRLRADGRSIRKRRTRFETLLIFK